MLEGGSWARYRTYVDLLGRREDDDVVTASRQAMLADSRVSALVTGLAGWPGQVLSNHKSAGHPIHRLSFLADLGLRLDDPGMDAIVHSVMDHQSTKGPFQVLLNISKSYGGTGEDMWAWALCDAPLLVYALAKFGLAGDPKVQRAADHLAGLVRDNGWPCTGDIGKFRGPGRKEDPCPFANLAMLKALSAMPDWRDSDAARRGVEAQLHLWETRRERHPYMFYMGTDFCKLKAPLVWYDILHVVNVVSEFPWARQDPRLQDMASIIAGKADAEGRFTSESVWQVWSDWEFGQKKQPSRMVTVLAKRALGRIGF